MPDFYQTVSKIIDSKKIPTPIYFYDKSILQRQIDFLQEDKPKNLEIFYAMKGNSNKAILEIFREQNFGTEIASGGELFLAKKAGFLPQNIIFTGPAKTNKELSEAVKFGIKTIHIESVNEAQRLQEICTKQGKKQKIIVRINANLEIKTQSTQLSGCPSPFGISEDEFFAALPKILACKNLEFEGIHVYNASGVMEAERLLENVKNVFKLVQRLEQEFKINTPIIDFGGGLGINYDSEQKPIDIKKFYQGVTALNREFGFEKRKLIMEISRFLVAECGFYATEIIDIKESRKKVFYITDGGIQHFMRTALFQHNHPISILKKSPENTFYQAKEDEPTETVQITGSLCTGLDVLASEIKVPKSKRGDIVLIEKSGCYGLNAAITNFLSHEMPTEILIDGSDFQVIRKRGRYEDLLINQEF